MEVFSFVSKVLAKSMYRATRPPRTACATGGAASGLRTRPRGTTRSSTLASERRTDA